MDAIRRGNEMSTFLNSLMRWASISIASTIRHGNQMSTFQNSLVIWATISITSAQPKSFFTISIRRKTTWTPDAKLSNFSCNMNEYDLGIAKAKAVHEKRCWTWYDLETGNRTFENLLWYKRVLLRHTQSPCPSSQLLQDTIQSGVRIQNFQMSLLWYERVWPWHYRHWAKGKSTRQPHK